MAEMMKMAKRVTALVLALTLMLSCVGGYAPGWFSALATEDMPIAGETSPAPDDPASEPTPTASAEPTATNDATEPEAASAEPTATATNDAAEPEVASAEPTATNDATEPEAAPAEPTPTATNDATEPEVSSADPTATPESSESAEPTATPESNESAEPTTTPESTEPTVTPESTESTEPTVTPETSEEPETTTTPETTATPEASQEPETSEETETTTTPETTATPEPSQEPETPANPEAAPTSEDTPEVASANRAAGLMGVSNLMAAMSEVTTTSDAAGVDMPAPEQTTSQAAANDGDDPKGTSVLEQKVKTAMVNGVNGVVTVLLTRNTFFTGNKNEEVVIDIGQFNVGENFEYLELVAEDAGDDGMQGEGYTRIDADLVIKGIKVVMKSVTMGAERTITVRNENDATGENAGRGGALVYYGTKDFANDVAVKVGNKSSAEIYTSDEDDIISATTQSGAEKLIIHAGDGTNTVNADIGGGSLQIVTGSGKDTVNVNIEGAHKGAYINTGANTDTINLMSNGNGPAEMTVPDLDADGNELYDEDADGNPIKLTRTYNANLYVHAGEGDDILNLDVRAGSGNMVVNTGKGGDTVEISKGDNRSVENLDYDFTYNDTEAVKNVGAGAHVTLVNGDENAVDRFTVDANTGLAVDELHFEGGKGASVYLLGSLNEVENPIEYYTDAGVTKGFQLHVASDQDATEQKDRTLRIVYDIASKKYNFTDSLDNKKRVEVYDTGTGAITVNAPFTDYVVKTPVNAGNTITVNAADPLLLSNLVLDTDEFEASVTGQEGVAYDELSTLNVPTISAANLNVLLKGKTINIDGAVEVKAQNVRAESSQGSLSLGGAYEAYLAGESFGDIAADMISVLDSATINVSGKITTEHDIDLVTRVKHFGSMFTLMPDSLNLLNVKIASAKVNINDRADLTAGGSVTALAKIQTTTGYTFDVDDVQTGGARTVSTKQEGGPVAVTVVLNDSAVNVASDAKITAGEDIRLNALSDIHVYNYAFYGAWKSPVALAITAIQNKANVAVHGSLTAGRKVLLNASGKIEDETAASHKDTNDVAGGGAVGGFLALNIVDQQVNAVIGRGATVVAGGDVAVHSSREANIETIADAGGDQLAGQSQSAVAGVKLLKSIAGPLWDKFKNLTGYSTQMEAFYKNVVKISAGTYSVKLVEVSEENEKHGSATVKTKVGALDSGKNEYATYVVVDPKPNAGYIVESIVARYLGHGNDGKARGYQYVAIGKNGNDQYVFLLEHDDVEIFVTYAESGKANPPAVPVVQEVDANQLEDAIEVPGLIQDAVDGVADNPDDDDDFIIEGGGENVEVVKTYQLDFYADISGGVIATWKVDKIENGAGENLKQVYGGQQVRLVPNPDNGKKLKRLWLTYSHTVDGFDVSEEIEVTADAQGHYVFTVPKDAEETTFTVHATFEDGAAEAKQPAHKQATGALAVGVVQNEGGSVIESGSTVTAGYVDPDHPESAIPAGGKVDMFGFMRTVSKTLADGTAIDSEAVAKRIEEEEAKTEMVQDTKYTVTGAKNALKVSASLPGEIGGDRRLGYADDGSIASPENPKITFKPDRERQEGDAVRVLVSYYTAAHLNYSKGSRVTVQYTLGEGSPLTYDSATNTYTFTANLAGFADAVGGSTIDVHFIVEKNGERVPSDGQGASQYVVPNAINISVNAIKGEGTAAQPKSIGAVNFQRIGYEKKSGSEELDYSKPLYYFTISPEAGYKCDPATEGTHEGADILKSDKKVLYASWVGVDGSIQKASLIYGGSTNVWYFKAVDGNTSVPPGALITINAVFSEDKREVIVQNPQDAGGEIKHGTASLSKDAVKQGDKLIITLNPDDGWYPSLVNVYKKSSTTNTTEVMAAATRDPNDPNKFVVESVPAFSSGEKLYVVPVFEQKNITLANQKQDLIKVDEKACKGQTVTIAPTDKQAEAGMKLSSATVTYGADQTIQVTIKDGIGTFTIPTEEGFTETQLTITGALQQKEHEIKALRTADGDEIVPASGYADANDKVTLNIKPRDGYRAKAGTVKLKVTTDSGVKQIVASWVKENTYEATLSADGTITGVEVLGEFEPGSDGVELSLGVALAVGVTLVSNLVEIQGEQTIQDAHGQDEVIGGAQVTAANGLNMIALSVGNKAVTEAKAGFNKGDTGVAGAFAVQVARTTTSSYVRGGAELIEQGNIFVMGKTKQEFKVNANAAGKKDANEAKDTGVGAGIAFAVNSAETVGEIEDGVKLLNGSNVTGVNMNVSQKLKDQVSAKAGAAGGSAWVPVAAVDVFTGNVRAKLGRLDLSQWQADVNAKSADERTDAEKSLLAGYLPVLGSVKIKAKADSAKVQYNHDVAADASARGDGTAMGGAFIVTWITNDVNAILRQSLSATKDIAVSASGGEALKAVATAAVSGGDKGDKDEGGDGSADKQANKLLKGAGGIAGRYGGMDGNAIRNGANDRQKAETSEESVAGAGAFVLNVQKNRVRAEIEDGVNIITAGKLSVTSQNRTDATIRANASTTKSDVGVGIGVAINIVTMQNIARIGDGLVNAAGLELIADIAKMPTKIRTVTVVENVSAFEGTFTALVEEAIKDWLGEDLSDKLDFLTAGISAAAGKIANTLIVDLNLQDLFKSSDTFDGIARGVWERVKERFTNLPKMLFEPLLAVYEETYGAYQDFDADAFGELLLQTIKDAWDTAINGAQANIAEVFKKSIMGAKDALLASVIDIVTDKITGKGGDPGEKLVTTLRDTIANGFSEVVKKTGEDVLRNLSAKLPFVNESNIAFVNEMRKTTLDQIKKSIVPYVTDAFRKQVWDYEPVVARLKQDGFAKTIKDELRKLLKESAVAMTNEAIDKLVGKANVQFEREPVEDRHIITTQAIAGAGAKTKSGAGSLAIAVADLTTRAEIGASGVNAVTVTGDMTVNAEELRRVRTHATAAVDADGEPDNNDGEGDTQDSQTGGGDDAQTTITDDKLVTVTTGVGGSAKFRANSDDGMFYVYAEEGYRLLRENAVRTYAKPDGTEVVDSVDIHESYDAGTNTYTYYIVPTEGIEDIALMDEDELEAFRIGFDIRFNEELMKLPDVTNSVSGSSGKEYSKEITLSVEDRESEDGVAWGKVNDLAEIMIPVEPGLLVKSIIVTSKGDDGNFSVLSYGRDGAGQEYDGQQIADREFADDEIVLASSNDAEAVYVFKVPSTGVDTINVIFEDNTDAQEVEQQRQAQRERDRAGRSVGVGAAFALTYGTSEVVAEIGSRAQGVSAGTLAVTASSEHEEENYATAGIDPFEGVSEDFKDFALDAALSINILDNVVRAAIAEGGKVTTTGLNHQEDEDAGEEEEEDEDEEEDLPEDIEVTAGSLIVSATEISKNETKASAFATGTTTAVGASVAVNVSLSDIKASLATVADVAGKAVVRSHTLNKDNNYAFASALGADMQRTFNKYSEVAGKVSDKANDVTSGKIFDKKQKKGNDTAGKIADRLNTLKKDDAQEARDDLPVSVNLLRSQNVEMDNAQEAFDQANEAGDFVNVEGGQDLDEVANPNQKKTLQVAATVGFTVSLHHAVTEVLKAVSSQEDIQVSATNAGNFRTRATAAAMSKAEGPGKTIAAAIGVSISKNTAETSVEGDLIAEDGDVTVASNLKQNLTDAYRGLLAVQSIAGSVSSKGTDYSIAGALSLMWSYAETTAEVANGLTLSGNNVSVTANDKSKLAVRAGGVNISKGANVGAGVSIASIWSANTVLAKVGDNASIRADGFKLSAVKDAVTFDDYKFPLTWRDLISDTSALDDEERENVYPGLIDIHRAEGEGGEKSDESFTIDINLDTYALMKIPDMLNFLASKNYYTEAIAGSLLTGQADSTKPNKLNLAGSIAIVRALNDISAILGANVSVAKGEKGDQRAGDVTIEARGDSTARMLGGALSAGGAKNSAGITVAFLYDEDTVKADVGDGVNIQAANVAQTAEADMDVSVINAAASLNTAAAGSKSIGGGISVLLLENVADAVVGKNATVDASGTLDVTADSRMELFEFALGASVGKRSSALGGTINFIRDQSAANVDIGADHSLKADGDVKLAARAVDDVLSILASASASFGDQAARAGSLNVIWATTKGNVTLASGGSGKGVASRKGSVSVLGEADANAWNVTVAAAGSKGKATGLSANINIFGREAGVDIKGGSGYRIDAAKDVLSSAYGNDYSVMVAVAAAASSNGALAGNLPILVSSNKITNAIGAGTVTAGGEAAFAARLDDVTRAVAGALGFSKGSNAAAATGMVVHKRNTVTTDMGAATVTAAGSSGALAEKLPGEAGAFKGVFVGANVKDDLVAAAAGIAVSGNRGLNGNLLWASNANIVKADASRAALNALSMNARGAAVGGGSVTVQAQNESEQLVLAGGLNAAKSIAAGASVVALTAEKQVTALAHIARAWQDVNVSAENTDKVLELAINAGGSQKTAVEIGVAYQQLQNKVNAVVASEIEAMKGGFNLRSVNNTTLDNVAVAVAGAGKYAVTPVLAISAFAGESNAILAGGTVKAAQGATISADSDKDLSQYTIGVAASGKAAVSGAVSIMSLKDTANALVSKGTNITAKTLDVTAKSDYDLDGYSGAIAASGKYGATVNGMLTIAKSNALAEMQGAATLTGKASVKASAVRDIVNVAIAAGIGGEAGAGVTIMGLVAGDRMDQDAADMLTYGNASQKSDDDKAFDAQALVDKLHELGVKDTSALEQKRDASGNVTQTSVADDLKGNGHYNKDMSVGSGGKFDASSGYVDGNIYEGTSDGENKQQMDETGDVKSAKLLGGTSYSADPQDSIVARIGGDAVITAANVDVIADQDTRADVFGGAVGIGGSLGGAGVSLAVAFLRSNVIATTLGKLTLTGEGTVNVKANSTSGSVAAQAGSEEAARTAAINEGLAEALQAATRSIRVIGLAVGVGNAGIGIAGSAVRTDNITRANVGGSVKNAGALNVKANSDYGNVAAYTLSVGGGVEAGLSAAVAVAVANGTLDSRIDETANITGANTGISVTTNAIVKAKAAAVSAAVSGSVSGAAGVAVASNQLTQNTSVDRGAKIDMTGNSGSLTVKGSSATTADSYLLGVSISGGGAVGLGAAVSNVKPTLNTTVGVNGAGTTALGKLASVDVRNDASSSASANVLSVAVGGALALQGNALLVFNDTEATAKVASASGDLGSLKINGELDAQGDSVLAAAAVGANAGGASVSYVDVHSRNDAILDTDSFTATVRGDLTVSTGEDANRKTQANATSVAAAVSPGASVGINAAVARNRAENNAVIQGKNGLTAGTVNLKAKGEGNAETQFYGLNVGLGSVALSASVAINEATNRATMKLGGALEGDLNVDAGVKGKTDAGMLTGSGALIGVKMNVALAYGRTHSLVDVELGKAPVKKVAVNVNNQGSDAVTSTIDNQSFEAFSVAGMVGSAFTQDVYNTRVKLAGGDYKASKVNLSTSYVTSADAAVTPSAAGVDVSLLKVAINEASAKSTAYAGTELEIAGGSLNADGDVSVATTGSGKTNAQVKSAKFVTVSAVSVGVNTSESNLSGKQAATLRLNGGEIKHARAVNVQSITDQAEAAAAVGNSGVDEAESGSVSIKLASVDVNSASATENLASTAAILGGGRDANRIAADSLTLKADTALEKVKGQDGSVNYAHVNTSAKAKSASGAEVGLVSGGGLLADATSTDSFNAVLDGVSATIAGDASLTAATHTLSSAVGTSPGSLKGVEVSVSKMYANVGTEGDKQTSKVLVGANSAATLTTGGAMNIAASNDGFAQTQFTKGFALSLGEISVALLPTESWYDTGVTIGDNTMLTAGKSADISTSSTGGARSAIDATSVGVNFDLNVMKGNNTLTDENNIDIGNKAQITADGDLNLAARTSNQMTASSKFQGGGAFAGECAYAKNTLARNVRVNVADGAELESTGGALNITSASGEADDILTEAHVKAGGLFLVGDADADTSVTSANEINVGQSARLTADGALNLLARATSRKANADEFGVTSDAVVKAGGVGINPDADANLVLNLTTFISINRDPDSSRKTTQLKSNRGSIGVLVDNAGLRAKAHTNADGSAAAGWSCADSVIEANLMNTIWVDSANLYARKTARLLASNAGDGAKPYFEVEGHAEMYAVGDALPSATLKGLPYNQVRTYDARRVSTKGEFTHIAINPREDVTKKIAAIYDTLVSSGEHDVDDEIWDWEGAKYRCDFCAKGEAVAPSSHHSDYARAGARAGKGAFAKALSPLNDIQKMVETVNGITKARYGEEDCAAAGRIFVLDLEVPLEKDVWLSRNQLGFYRLWVNSATHQEVYLLPNSTRLYANGGMMLQYVAEVIRGDVRGDGESHEIDIITALTKYAFAHPIIPIGSGGSLDFSTGTFTLPSNSDFELYLDEISSRWLLACLNAGFIRMLSADQAAVNDCAVNGADLPDGTIVEGMTYGGERDGWKVYWLGDTPETAQDPDQTLIYLLVNEETDEVDAFRTSVNAIASGEAPVDVSLYLYRDSKSDRRGEEKYNAMFFDTPEGEKSLVKVVTNVLMHRELELPKALKIVLRGHELDGADLPAYAISGHFFAMNDGTDGSVSMFGGFYQNTFDGDVFESDYIRIEGILNGDLYVLIKSGQPIWPEWIDEKTARDLLGNLYELTEDGDWVRLDMAVEDETGADDAQAA